MAAGAHHSYALRTAGTVASWGRNYRSELGDGTGTSRRTPVSVLGVSGATTIGSGRDMGIVTLADGRAKSWGHNLYGQLGDGTTTNRTSAVFVPGVTNAVKSAGGGATYGVVLVGDGAAVNQDPTARISGSCTDLTCPLSGSTSTDSDGTITGYAWDFGDGETATGVAPGHTYEEAGTYEVTLTVTDNQGATDIATLEVEVTAPVDPPPNADPVAVISGTTCTYLSCPLSGSSSTDDGTITGYAWNFGDGETGTGVSPGHVYDEAGTWTVTLTVTDNAGATDIGDRAGHHDRGAGGDGRLPCRRSQGCQHHVRDDRGPGIGAGRRPAGAGGDDQQHRPRRRRPRDGPCAAVRWTGPR